MQFYFLSLCFCFSFVFGNKENCGLEAQLLCVGMCKGGNRNKDNDNGNNDDDDDNCECKTIYRRKINPNNNIETVSAVSADQDEAIKKYIDLVFYVASLV